MGYKPDLTIPDLKERHNWANGIQDRIEKLPQEKGDKLYDLLSAAWNAAENGNLAEWNRLKKQAEVGEQGSTLLMPSMKTTLRSLRVLVLILGVLWTVGICLRPPDKTIRTTYLTNRQSSVPHKAAEITVSTEHRWIWNQPPGVEIWVSRLERTAYETQIDVTRLGIYLFAGLIITTGLMLLLKLAK